MVKYPSYRFRSYTASPPSPIWGILVELPVVQFIFKDRRQGTWWVLAYESTITPHLTSQSPSKIKQTPFVELVANGDLAIILLEEHSSEPSAFIDESFREGILVTITEEKDDTIYAKLGEAVTFRPLSAHEVIIYDAAERLMQELRSWEQEDAKGLGIAEQVSKERVSKVRAKCMKLTKKLLAEEPELENAVIVMLGEGREGWKMSVSVLTWFNRVGEGWRVEEEKTWCVD